MRAMVYSIALSVVYSVQKKTNRRQALSQYRFIRRVFRSKSLIAVRRYLAFTLFLLRLKDFSPVIQKRLYFHEILAYRSRHESCEPRFFEILMVHH